MAYEVGMFIIFLLWLPRRWFYHYCQSWKWGKNPNDRMPTFLPLVCNQTNKTNKHYWLPSHIVKMPRPDWLNLDQGWTKQSIMIKSLAGIINTTLAVFCKMFDLLLKPVVCVLTIHRVISILYAYWRICCWKNIHSSNFQK